jgi:hypothetical protein
LSARAWQVLGLAPTDDVRAIKRAYAACLKRCRPEDDPEGFAQLRGAYEWLLAQVGAGVQPSTRPSMAVPAVLQPSAHDEVDRPAGSQPAVERPRTTAQIAAEVLHRAQNAEGHDATVAFGQWLASQPELMLLERKPLVSRALLVGITRGAGVLPPAFALLQEFFHWDDQAEQRRLALAGFSVDAAQGQVQADELRRVIARGATRGKAYEYDFEEILQAGAGRGAWWLAIKRTRKHAVPAQLQMAIRQYGYRAVEQVVGQDTLGFWQRALDAQPNRLQWVMVLAKPLLIGMAIVLGGLLCMLLGRIIDGPQIAPDGSTSLGDALVSIGLGVMLLGSLLGSVALLRRWLRSGPLARAVRSFVDARDRLGLDRRLWRGVLATVLLFLLACCWPTRFSPWPYLLMVGLLVLFHLRDRRSLTALAIVWWGAAAAFSAQASSTLLTAAAMPACLWLGHAIHDLLQRRHVRGFSRSSVVMVTCLVICLLLVGVGIATTRAM